MKRGHHSLKKGAGRLLSCLLCLLFLGALTKVAADAGGTDGYYAVDGKIAEVSPPLDEKSVARATDRFSFLNDTYLAPNQMHPYIAIVPDKDYFLSGEKNAGQMDYAALFAQVYGQMDYAVPIDLTGVLDGDFYYATDSHWKQECLPPVAAHIACAMQQSATREISYETKTAADHFVGSYADAIIDEQGQRKQRFSSVLPDTIRYLTNETLENASVYYYDTGITGGIYQPDKLESRNPYDFFLSGPAALIHMKNSDAPTEQRLIVFRDSYGSSLVPLLLPYYRELLIVDIRYTMSDRLGEQIDFAEWAGADALFLYSTTLLNRSISLR